MRLFFREHSLLIVVQAIQMLVVLSIFWFDGYRDIQLFFYTTFLNFFILGCYLFYYYISRQKLYKRLNQPLESLDDSLQKTDDAPISIAFDQVLHNQYRLFQSQLESVEKEQGEHRKFMDQWVHQMKTPLSVIELTAQNLDEPESSNIREETERMKTSLNMVLYMARLRTIEQDFHIKPVNLVKLVDEVNGENKRFYIRNKVYPKLEVEKEGMMVETDEKWLFFILSQLINNAVKYSSGTSERIVTSIYARGKEAILEVKDFGIGIPEVDKRRIFDPFYTGENGRKFRVSTGMGLYLTKETLDTLGHRIEMESELGKGTTFRIIFTETQNLTSL
ncbi:HAMP domain-containing histidine kinase [Robertmurraya yapensis]|uniref:histidine kinase n=1 Tax=Bacillus yapensis TaxID=2492960 RepID=A0A3S0RM84_9BACI|nr:sensor histidine kinase [Bacillus yapensis]RTR31861.1 HAMP domain-containing histidine kinase [Bacillus yapensis]TKS95874.1 HAMP domain-containing histidine kinase [Bacillus yapensis]